MTLNNPPVWGIRAGSNGEADSLFLQHNYVAVGWPEVGNLGTLPATSEAFKAKIGPAYPNQKPGAVPVVAGMLMRFVHTIKEGDLVVYPSKIDKQVHIGQVIGPYQHNPNLQKDFPNLRPVKWLKSLPRPAFTQGALYELGSIMTLFQIKNYADEIIAAAHGKAKPPPIDKDDTVAVVAENIEQTTRDFILKLLAQELKGHPFADFVAQLLGTMGYRTRVSSPGPDGGVDIIAHKDELGFEPPIIKVQVKSSDSSVGGPIVSALYGQVANGEYGLLVTLGTFTPQAQSFAQSKSNLRLIDGYELVSLILDHYEQLDSRYKAKLPLKRVYVPQPIQEVE
jgi:restriction system protein